jgi:transposase-like protein
MSARPISPPITDADRERWWSLSIVHHMTASLIARRYGVGQHAVSDYLKKRRDEAGIARPERYDTVTVPQLAGRFLADLGRQPRARSGASGREGLVSMRKERKP